MNLQDNINKMKLELAEMEKQLQAKKQIKLQYGAWHMTSRGYIEEYMPEIDSLDATNFGLRRTTRVLATEMRDRIVTSSQIEARAREIDHDWAADWSDDNSGKSYVGYDYKSKKYFYKTCSWCQNIGIPYMSETTAQKIVDELNEVRFVLGYKE